MKNLKFVLLSFVQIILGVPLIVAGGGYLILILIFAIEVIFTEVSSGMSFDAASGFFMFIILPFLSIAFCGLGFGLLKTLKDNWISLKNNKGKFSFYS